MVGPGLQIVLAHIRQGPNDDVASIVTQEFGGHAFQGPTKKQVEHEGLQDVVSVVAQGNLGGPQAMRDVVECASAKATAQAAHGRAWTDLGLHNGVGVLLLDVVIDAQTIQVTGQHVLGKAGLLLIQINGKDLEVKRGALLQIEDRIMGVKLGDRDGPQKLAEAVIGSWPTVRQALAAFAPQLPEVVTAVETAVKLLTSGTAPTAAEQAQFDAAVLAAHNAVQAA